MSERQYNDEEVAAIFERASETEHAALRVPAEGKGLTLAALQDIGREVGISPESISLAARSLDQAGRPASRMFMGLPIGVGRTVEFDRPLTDSDWERLVADLRETFEARGMFATGALRIPGWARRRRAQIEEVTARAPALIASVARSFPEVLMPYLFVAGRVLYGGFFLLAGLDHFRRVGMMAPYAGAKGIPAPRLAVLGSGLLIVLGGLSVLLGVRPTWGVLLLTVFLLPTSFLMHNYWAATDPSVRQSDLINFKKNIALLGAAWMLLLIPQPWPLSLRW